MPDFVREAGWPIYPILIVGALAVLVAARHALWPARGAGAIVAALAAATLLLGIAGTALGVQQSAGAIRDVAPEMRWIFLIGVKESLYNLVAATLLATLAALL